MKIARKVAVALGIAVVVLSLGLVCVPTMIGAIIGLRDIPDKLNWKSHTSPLSQDVIDDICLKFQLSPSDPHCQRGAQVYAPDFFGAITKGFRPHDGVSSTYAEVQEKLGKYQFDYNPPVTEGNGLSYFVAYYDLKGDRVYPINMFFYADSRLWRIIADVGD